MGAAADALSCLEAIAGAEERLLERSGRAVLPIILFSGDPLARLEEPAARFGAAASIGKDQGLGAMLVQVDDVLSEIIW